MSSSWLVQELYYINKYQKNQQFLLEKGTSSVSSSSLKEDTKSKKKSKKRVLQDNEDFDDADNIPHSKDILEHYHQNKMNENSKENSNEGILLGDDDTTRFEISDIYSKKTILELFPPEDEKQEQEWKEELSEQYKRIKQLFSNLNKEEKDAISKKNKKKKNKRKKREENDEDAKESETLSTSHQQLENFDLLLFKQQGSIESERPLFFEQFATLMNNPLFHDVVFRVIETEEVIYAHKTILQLRSEYFRTLFTSGMKESEVQIPEIEIDLPKDIFMILLEFIYTGKMKVNPKNAINVLAAANQFSLGDAKELLSNYFKTCLDPATVCYIIEEANFYHAKDLFLFCMQYIVNNASKVFTKENLKYLSTETFRKILHTQALSIEEYPLFLACVEWAKVRSELEKEQAQKQYDAEDIDEEDEPATKTWQEYFAEIVDLIRFSAMEAKTLRDSIEQNKQFKKVVPMRTLLDAYKSMVLQSELSNKNGPRNGSIVFKFDETSIPNDTTLSKNRLKATCNAAVTNTLLGNIALQNGRMYYFEFKVESAMDPNDIMIGVCDKSVYDKYSFLSHNARGYAYYGYNGAAYHNSVEKTYATAYKAGDVIGVLADLKKGNISFTKNGKNLGVAFTGVKGPLYPAVSLYNTSDSVSIVNRHSYIKGEEDEVDDFPLSDTEEQDEKEEQQSKSSTPVAPSTLDADNDIGLNLFD